MAENIDLPKMCQALISKANRCILALKLTTSTAF